MVVSMNHARSYRFSWTRDPRRESAALLVAVRSKVLMAYLAVALVGAILTVLAHAYLVTLIILLLAAILPVTARGRLRRSLAAGDQEARVTVNDREIRLGKGQSLEWDTFTHWREMSHYIVLMQRRGRRATTGMLIPRSCIRDEERDGFYALLDKHLTRES